MVELSCISRYHDRLAQILDTIKLAEDAEVVAANVAVVLRVYEALGGRGVVSLTTPRPVASIVATNLLEEYVDDVMLTKISPCVVSFPLKPFQVVTLRAVFE